MKPDLKIVVSNPLPLHEIMAAPEQAEMPFAVVNGEPMTHLPRDLYIPPQALEIFLEAFEGPLDLLLYLIRKQNVDILNIPIAEITRQYTRYIELMQDLQLELAGEYLVMAATLAEIKSRMLLPRPPGAGELGEEGPRAARARPPARPRPQVTLQEMLLALKEVAQRAEMFAHHHVRREPLSVRERMSNILAALEQGSFVEFSRLFTLAAGRAGVTVA